MWLCKEDAKKYFGSKPFIAPMQRTTCDVCGKDKECYNIPYKVSMREIVRQAGFMYKTVITQGLKGLQEAERLKAQGWQPISVGINTIIFEKEAK